MNKLKTAGKNRTLFIVVIILAVLLVINVLIFVNRLYDTRDYEYEYSDLSHAVKERSYSELASMVKHNDKSIKKPKEDTTDFSLLMDFYEAANMYDCYALSGDTERAAEQAEHMDELESRMTDEEVIAAAEELRSLYNGVRSDFSVPSADDIAPLT